MACLVAEGEQDSPRHIRHIEALAFCISIMAYKVNRQVLGIKVSLDRQQKKCIYIYMLLY